MITDYSFYEELFHTTWKEKCFLLLDSYAKLICLRWRVDDLTLNSYIQGRAGVTHRIHMESCLLHVNARPSIWKPLFKKSCSWHWACHVINTPPRWRERKKKLQMQSVSAGCCQSQAVTHHLFSPLPAFLHHTSWSNQRVIFTWI